MWIITGAVLVTAMAAAAGGWWWLRPPSTPPAYAESAPEVSEEGLVSVSHTVVIDAPREAVMRWNSRPDLDLSEMIQAADGFPVVVGTEPLVGDWDPDGDRSGDRRRVEFADGHFLAEEVLVDSGGVFRYAIWGFTDARRLAVRHGVAQFEFVDHGERTGVTWTYSLAPTATVTRPFVADFLTGPMSDMMRGTLEAMRAGVESG